MKQLSFYILLLFCISCDEKNIIQEDENNIVKVCAFYTTKENPEIQIPDSKSKVFVYYGSYSIEFAGYTLQDGNLIKNDQVVLPDQDAIIDKNGNVILELEQFDVPFTIIVVSNYCGHVSINSYPPNQKGVIFTTIFHL